MFNKEVPNRQLWVFVITALAAPLAQLASGCSWAVVLVTGVVCGFICYAVLRLSGHKAKWGKSFCFVQWLWLSVVLSHLSFYSAQAWPTGDSQPAVPLVLLALAAWAASGGTARASRAVTAGAWIAAALYAAVICAGVGSIRVQWLVPSWEIPPAALIAVFLIPCILMIIPGRKGRNALPLAAAAGIGTLFAVWAAGNLSPKLAGQFVNPFYEAGKSVRLLGAVERLESLISAVLTMGWFALMTLLLSVGGCFAEEIRENRGKAGVFAGAAAAAAFRVCKMHIPEEWLAGGCLVFWVFLPLGVLGLGLQKKS